jgi:hypothetical protein
MQPLMFGVLTLLSFALATAQKSTRQADFSNFNYPISGNMLGHDRLKWLDISTERRVQLLGGKSLSKSPGFTLKSVTFADVTGSGYDDAIVVLHFNAGGTQQTDYVYFYSMANKIPKLLAYFHAGDRAYSGLYKVYGIGGVLVVDLFDPDKRTADCCSSGILRTRYKWQSGHFHEVGAPEKVVLQEP